MQSEEEEVFWLLPGKNSQGLGRRHGVVEGCEADKGQYGSWERASEQLLLL